MKRSEMMKKILAAAIAFALAFALASCVSVELGRNRNDEATTTRALFDFASLYERPRDPSEFSMPELDLRGHDLQHHIMEQWFLQRTNYHRINYGIHPYILHTPAVITSIEHSLDMRDNDFSRNVASDGRTHQERHHRWLGYHRTKVTSAHSSSHNVAPGPLTQDGVNAVVDRIFESESSREFLLNPTYYYIGFGFSIDQNGRGRLSITMATGNDEREAHRARNREEREAHRQEYLERVRAERGWTG